MHAQQVRSQKMPWFPGEGNCRHNTSQSYLLSNGLEYRSSAVYAGCRFEPDPQFSLERDSMIDPAVATTPRIRQ